MSLTLADMGSLEAKVTFSGFKPGDMVLCPYWDWYFSDVSPELLDNGGRRVYLILGFDSDVDGMLYVNLLTPEAETLSLQFDPTEMEKYEPGNQD